MAKKDYKEVVILPEKVSMIQEGNFFIVKGPKGEVKKALVNPKIKTSLQNNTFTLEVKKGSKREKTSLYTINAHVRNMIKGVTQGHVYKLKICSGHFPMTVTATAKEVSVKNFLGEKIPRVMAIPEGVKVKVDNITITVESVNLDLAGQTAASIEKLTRITSRDLRIFQDGGFIFLKKWKTVV